MPHIVGRGGRPRHRRTERSAPPPYVGCVPRTGACRPRRVTPGPRL